jgi:hypothetical protein
MTNPTLCLVAIILALTCVAQAARAEDDANKKEKPWRALHLLGYNTDKDLEKLGSQVPKLAEMGLNVLILEVNYHYRFESYPKLRDGSEPITSPGATQFADLCRKHGVRMIPQFQCLGHQSWKATTFPLLTVYPELDLAPGAFPKNEGIYCREWDPTNPKVNEIVFKLIDELLDGFGADAFHVGMDEVFLLGSKESPTTKGQDPAKLFGKAVNDLHKHLVEKRKVAMLMWADRLFDGKKYDWDEWESAKNGTAPAVDLIPKDIILCPWHYNHKEAYPSIPLFVEKGFRVLPASWDKLDASKALIEYSHKLHSPKVLGHLFTTWSGKRDDVTTYPQLVEGLKLLKAQER